MLPVWLSDVLQPRLAARRAGLEKSRGSCNERNDRRSGTIGGLTVRCFPNDRRPDSWCPAHVARLVSAASAARTVSGVSRTPTPAWTRGGLSVCRPWTWQLVRRGLDAVPRDAAAAGHSASMQGAHGWRPVGMATSAAVAEQQRSYRGHRLDSSAVAVRDAVQVPDTRGHPAASGATRWVRSYGNRSPGWRPLVGCSQRRWTRPSRTVRRPRSWPRT
jgi:hypothetical protein